MALSLLLVIGAALFARSLGNLEQLDPGFTRNRLAIAFVDPGRNGYKGQRLHDFYERLREGVERVPGVQSASLSAISPLAGMRWNGDVAVEGYEWKAADDHAVDMNAVGPRFFETMGIPVAARSRVRARGQPGRRAPNPGNACRVNPSRSFPGRCAPSSTRASPASSSKAAARLAAECLSPRSSMQPGRTRSSAWSGTCATSACKEKPEPMIYVPVWRGDLSSLTLAVRTRGEVEGLSQSIRSVLAGIDVAVPLRSVRTADEQIDSDIVTERLVATLATLFGGLALLLAAIGLYAVIAYFVARRTREIGIRLALGAQRRSVLWLVMRDGVLLVGVGAIIGVGAALGLSRLVRSLLFGLEAHDPTAATAGIAVLLAVAALAVLVPARRAMAIEPSQALRDE